MKNYLSLNGLSYFFNKLQDIFVGKSYVDESISNIPDELPNYTDSDNNKILTILFFFLSIQLFLTTKNVYYNMNILLLLLHI